MAYIQEEVLFVSCDSSDTVSTLWTGYDSALAKWMNEACAYDISNTVCDFLSKWLRSLYSLYSLYSPSTQAAPAPETMTTWSQGSTHYHMTTSYLIRISLFILTLHSRFEVICSQHSYFIPNLRRHCFVKGDLLLPLWQIAQLMTAGAEAAAGLWRKRCVDCISTSVSLGAARCRLSPKLHHISSQNEAAVLAQQRKSGVVLLVKRKPGPAIPPHSVTWIGLLLKFTLEWSCKILSRRIIKHCVVLWKLISL